MPCLSRNWPSRRPAGPAPMMTTWVRLVSIRLISSQWGWGYLSGFFKGNQAHACRHRRVVVPMHAPCLLRYRAAHDEPHDQFDAFRACLLHEFLMRHRGQALRIALDAIEKILVEGRVHGAKAPAVQLMRHTTGAEDHHAQIAWVGFNRLTDGLTELVAAARGRQRVQEDVHCQRYGGDTPVQAMLKTQVHRHE